ncbi:MAG TPA: hypothetical protein VFQ92_07730 [Blastocatellia bacterium]|nr:hypothetical protein [Blastocatellia bacterium]
MEEKDRKKTLDAVEALLKDMERELAERGDLTDEDKAAIERLLELCDRGEILLARDED